MTSKNTGSEWISISDMMAGVMMIFLLIAVAYMVVISKTEKTLALQNAELKELNKQMSDIAKTHKDLQTELFNDLVNEFSKNLDSWNAEIDADNTFRFKEPEILFDQGKKEVKDRFKEILDDFFPRYIKILSQEKYKDDIEEIRIEGHTSTEWQNAKSLEARYLGNAELSQARALEVLKYCFNNKAIDKDKEWLVSVLRANGLSFAKPLESPELSRRVEFKTLTKSNQKILKILNVNEELSDNNSTKIERD
ncbi:MULTISPECIES: OmpA/MotB family protein [Helicobacter]|uniref:OmpA family protein n=1 Tax=Helicobacter ibis TaxID=2962633 RepID=A0ABT4VD18_9HELI|nr:MULTISPECIES: OmpA family protein [Helicobacter]MDA3966654.1 OmpA family protein [Helicobacter sp. WB40]MDA3968578.1 OmpA family protein [Helicobacter ibis]